MSNTETKNVSWTIFIWAIMVILGVIGYAVNEANQASNKADAATRDVSEVKGDTKAINKSLEFLTASVVRIENKLDKK